MIRFLSLFLFLALVVLRSAVANQQFPTYKVYWDISHSVVDDYQPSGRYREMVRQLSPLGFTFSQGASPLDEVDLSTFKILVLANGSFAKTFPTDAEVSAVSSFLDNGGGVLIMSDIAGSSGTAKIQKFADIFGAQVGVEPFGPRDVYSTYVGDHPAVADVEQVYIRYSSSIDPGELTTYVSYQSKPMLAAGEVGGGRVVLIADSDLFTETPRGLLYMDRADNRQLANSVFQYLAVPEPSSALLMIFGTACVCSMSRRRRRP